MCCQLSLQRVQSCLPSLSVNTVSVPPINVIKVTTAPTVQYINPVPEYVVMR